VEVDQVQQWLDAGWTEQAMAQVGKDICDAAATAFPNQNIKLPIGVTDSILGATDPRHTNGTQTTLCRDIEDYVYGNASLGIPPRPYANRFFMQRNSVDADWGEGTQYDTFVPGFDSGRYIKYMIRAHGHPNPPWTIPGQAGLQMVDSATDGPTNDCRQGGGLEGPCGPLCDPVCVMQTSLDVSLTYAVSYIEIFQDDAENPLFYDMVRATTLALGGTPRDMPPQTPTPTPNSDANTISRQRDPHRRREVLQRSGLARHLRRACNFNENEGIANPFPSIRAPSRQFKFHKRSLLFIRTHNETLSLAVRVSNPDCSP
jgi:hypothetical protein